MHDRYLRHPSAWNRGATSPRASGLAGERQNRGARRGPLRPRDQAGRGVERSRVSAREEVLKAHKALLKGQGKLSYFERRGILEVTVKDAWIGYTDGEFLYPCIAKTGGLLAVHYKGESRNGKGKRCQRWGLYGDDLPRKGRGKKPSDPAKIIPFGLETLRDLKPNSLIVLCCGEEDALSARQAGYVALSQPGAGLLEPVYAEEFDR